MVEKVWALQPGAPHSFIHLFTQVTGERIWSALLQSSLGHCFAIPSWPPHWYSGGSLTIKQMNAHCSLPWSLVLRSVPVRSSLVANQFSNLEHLSSEFGLETHIWSHCIFPVHIVGLLPSQHSYEFLLESLVSSYRRQLPTCTFLGAPLPVSWSEFRVHFFFLTQTILSKSSKFGENSLNPLCTRWSQKIKDWHFHLFINYFYCCYVLMTEDAFFLFEED